MAIRDSNIDLTENSLFSENKSYEKHQERVRQKLSDSFRIPWNKNVTKKDSELWEGIKYYFAGDMYLTDFNVITRSLESIVASDTMEYLDYTQWNKKFDMQMHSYGHNSMHELEQTSFAVDPRTTVDRSRGFYTGTVNDIRDKLHYRNTHDRNRLNLDIMKNESTVLECIACGKKYVQLPERMTKRYQYGKCPICRKPSHKDEISRIPKSWSNPSKRRRDGYTLTWGRNDESYKRLGWWCMNTYDPMSIKRRKSRGGFFSYVIDDRLPWSPEFVSRDLRLHEADI